MKQFAIFERWTHKYNDDYAHLDTQTYLCDVKVTPFVCTKEPESYDEGGNYVCYGRMPARLNKKGRARFLQAVVDTFSKQGCSHTYDCCGCASVYAKASAKGRQFKVNTRVRFNY